MLESKDAAKHPMEAVRDPAFDRAGRWAFCPGRRRPRTWSAAAARARDAGSAADAEACRGGRWPRGRWRGRRGRRLPAGRARAPAGRRRPSAGSRRRSTRADARSSRAARRWAAPRARAADRPARRGSRQARRPAPRTRSRGTGSRRRSRGVGVSGVAAGRSYIARANDRRSPRTVEYTVVFAVHAAINP